MFYLRGKVFSATLFAAVASMLVAVSPATAGPPLQYEGGFSFDDLYECGDFALADHTEVSFRGRLFSDAQGNTVRNLAHIAWRTTLTGDGFSFDADTDVNQDWDIPAGTLHESGKTLNIVVPGHGTVFREIGTAFHVNADWSTFDEGTAVKVGGPHQLTFGGQSFEEIVCAVGELFQ